MEIAIDRQGAELRTGMTANIDVLGEKREKVLTVPVEALFRKDDTEIVYVKKAEPLPRLARRPACSSQRVRRRARRTSPPAKLEDKDKWKEKFEVREVETGLGSFDKVADRVGPEGRATRWRSRTPRGPRRRRTVSDPAAGTASS